MVQKKLIEKINNKDLVRSPFDSRGDYESKLVEMGNIFILSIEVNAYDYNIDDNELNINLRDQVLNDFSNDEIRIDIDYVLKLDQELVQTEEFVIEVDVKQVQGVFEGSKKVQVDVFGSFTVIQNVVYLGKIKIADPNNEVMYDVKRARSEEIRLENERIRKEKILKKRLEKEKLEKERVQKEKEKRNKEIRRLRDEIQRTVVERRDVEGQIRDLEKSRNEVVGSIKKVRGERDNLKYEIRQAGARAEKIRRLVAVVAVSSIVLPLLFWGAFLAGGTIKDRTAESKENEMVKMEHVIEDYSDVDVKVSENDKVSLNEIWNGSYTDLSLEEFSELHNFVSYSNDFELRPNEVKMYGNYIVHAVTEADSGKVIWFANDIMVISSNITYTKAGEDSINHLGGSGLIILNRVIEE